VSAGDTSRPSITLSRGYLFTRDHIDSPESVGAGELAVFDESNEPLEFLSQGDTGFVLGSAIKHPHDLVLGYYSVHTSAQALERGEAEIQRIGLRLRAEGRLK
jgi:hypothetical protein